MNITLFFSKLKQLNINIQLHGDQIKINAPKDVLNQEIIDEIKENKKDIISFLRSSALNESYVEIELVDKQNSYPLSHAQKRLWAMYQFSEEKAVYNMPFACWFKGNLNLSVLENVFKALIERHESLRTAFTTENGEPVQQVIPSKDIHFELTHCNLKTEKNSETIVQEAIEREKAFAFDFSIAPLLRATIYTVENGRHFFLLNMHHIISDGWSVDILFKELCILYNAFLHNKENPLLPLRTQYKDYVNWQEKQLSGIKREEYRNYWAGQFTDRIPRLSLPTDHPRPVSRLYQGELVRKIINPDTVKALEEIGRQRSASMYMVYLAALKVLFYRYTNQKDIIIGCPVACREHPDLENQVGFYVNTLALRTQFDEDDTFLSLLDKVKKITLEGFSHQAYSFDLLIEDLNLDWDQSHSPLFDVMLTFQTVGIDAPKDVMMEGIEIEIHKLNVMNSKFDLDIDIKKENGDLELSIIFDTDLFSKKRINRMMDHLENLLFEIVHDQEMKLWEIPYLKQEEKGTENHAFSSPQTKSWPQSLMVLIEEQAAINGEKDAIIYNNKRVDYITLNQQSNQIARYLRETCGIKPGKKVGILLTHSERKLIILLGILKTGAAYIPIDSDWPPERIKHILETSQISILLTDLSNTLLDQIVDSQKSGYQFVRFQQISQELKSYSIDNLNLEYQPHDLAYILYTSGTTGRPKGVMIEHGSLWDYVHTFSEYFSIDSSDVVLNQSSLAFDTSIEEIFPAWTRGGCVVMVPQRGDVEGILDCIEKDMVSILSTTPRMLRELNESANQLSGLRAVISGGEELHWNQINKIIEVVDVFNSYGPTESTVCATYGKVKSNKPISLGKPLPNREVLILNQFDKIQAVGIVGEICIAGKGLSRGYLGQEELTKEKFKVHPLDQERRIYYTGDLGSWTEEAELLFHGRIDRQIKIRAYRVELGEIETVLMDHPGLLQTVVNFVGEKENEEAYLVAYYTAKKAVKGRDLRKYLGSRLPAYMIPRYLIQIKEIPINSNGKPDWDALQNEKSIEEVSGAIYIPPKTKLEKHLASIWRKILAKKVIGISDNFFELGGHSLKALQLSSRIHKELGVELSLRQLFQSPTIESLAKVINSQSPAIFSEISAITPQADYALSHAQRRLWVIAQMDSAGTAYNMPFSCWLEGDLDQKVFNQVFQEVVERHESLRTIFLEINGEPRQKILSSAEMGFEIAFEDIRDRPDRNEYVYAVIGSDGLEPFDLGKGPLLRAKLFQVEVDKHALLFTMHHIVTDGWSMEVLIDDIYSLYNGYMTGQPVVLSPLRIQYKDYTAWQLSQLSGEKMAVSKAYWKDVFEGELPVLDVPTDFARPAVKGYRGQSVEVFWHKELLDSVSSLAQSHGSSLYMVLMAGLNALLYRYTSQEDIVVGCPVTGRDHGDLENQVGFYVNTLAIRNRFQGEDTFSDLLLGVREQMLEGFSHQAYPFDLLIEELDIQRNLSRSPLFDTSLTLQNTDYKRKERPHQLEGVKEVGFDHETNICKFDLQFTVWEQSEGLGVSLIYNEDLFLPARIERLLSHYQNILLSVCKNSDQPLNEIDYLPASESLQLLAWGEGPKIGIEAMNLVSLFESQVTKTPDAIALAGEEMSFSYHQLNEMVNKLAHHLRLVYKIQPEDRVGILTEKSVYSIISILGTIKAGGVYVPIDSQLPSSRISFILDDIAVNAVLIDSHNLDKLIPIYSGSLIAIDIQLALFEESVENPVPLGQTSDLAYINYTSGSMGVPKGVLVEQKSIIRLVLDPDYVAFTESDALLQTGSLAFDAATFEIWGMLLNGGTLHILSHNVLLDTDRLSTEIESRGISIMWMTASWFNQVLDEAKDIFSGLKYLLIGGEKLSVQHISKLLGHYPDLKVINGYGPTENTTFSLCHRIETVEASSIPIGKPISGSSVYLLDACFHPVPIGIDGELFVGGAGLARGYLNQVELYAQKFISHPFAVGEKLYRTGDIGRWREDGTVDFQGRKDNQVKIRGFRIELGELEHSIQSYDQIGQAAVLIKESVSGEKSLVAFFEGESAWAEALKMHLQKTLPAYMIPERLVGLDKFPLTANGKVDKNALGEIEIVSEASQFYSPPETALESKLVQIWEEVLDRSKIGITDNFFELGGHSLKATRVLSWIHKETDVKLDLARFFENPTIQYLRGAIEAIQWLNKPSENEGNQESREGIIL